MNAQRAQQQRQAVQQHQRLHQQHARQQLEAQRRNMEEYVRNFATSVNHEYFYYGDGFAQSEFNELLHYVTNAMPPKHALKIGTKGDDNHLLQHTNIETVDTFQLKIVHGDTFWHEYQHNPTFMIYKLASGSMFTLHKHAGKFTYELVKAAILKAEGLDRGNWQLFEAMLENEIICHFKAARIGLQGTINEPKRQSVRVLLVLVYELMDHQAPNRPLLDAILKQYSRLARGLGQGRNYQYTPSDMLGQAVYRGCRTIFRATGHLDDKAVMHIFLGIIDGYLRKSNPKICTYYHSNKEQMMEDLVEKHDFHDNWADVTIVGDGTWDEQRLMAHDWSQFPPVTDFTPRELSKIAWNKKLAIEEWKDWHYKDEPGPYSIEELGYDEEDEAMEEAIGLSIADAVGSA